MTLKYVSYVLVTSVAATAMLLAPACAQGNHGAVQGGITDAAGTLCHDVQRIAVKRSDKADWEHTISRMRGMMVTQQMPDLTEDQAKQIAEYTSANFKPDHPYDANSRLPRELLTGKAVHYRLVTY